MDMILLSLHVRHVRHELLVPDLRSGGGVELLAGATLSNENNADCSFSLTLASYHLDTSLCYGAMPLR